MNPGTTCFTHGLPHMSLAGYGVTITRPTLCSECPIGYFSEGPLPRAVQAAAAADADAAGLALKANAAFDQAGPVLQAMMLGVPPPAPAPAIPANLLAGGYLLGPSSLPAGMPDTLNYPAALEPPAAADQGLPGGGDSEPGFQRSLQQLDPVFSTPTYNPCTFCGRGCFTERPAATSADQCSKFELALVAVLSTLRVKSSFSCWPEVFFSCLMAAATLRLVWCYIPCTEAAS